MKLLRIALPLLLSSITLMASAQGRGPLRIGVFSGATGDTAEVAAQEARKQGLEVRIVEFSDWTTPNAALDAGDLDANYFQHQAFLDNAIKQRGYKLKSIDVGVLSTFGLFSTKVKRVEDLKEGARLGIHNDASNQARALRLLEKNGLLKLRPGVGNWATIDDVVENPKKLKFVEIEGTQLVRSLGDIDIAVLSPFTLVAAGKPELANNALLYSRGDDVYYAGQFVVRSNEPVDPRFTQFVKIYHESPAVRQAIHKAFANNDKLYSLPWLAK
ncbi:MetQ/NlpA family ABC transporter substrate-binding protein [Variovorax saccharolyticus]|uniref:MetQ/NlpA family ABC transporter substrate-binding protein n=1 Tax=Variovorax saccharolyticus TaxID=3053516 RepID=UPI0025778D33|nr:MetQ/NlpA family ABC transporter substrate-binding protein [Variovorax sp. J31P216]MDM0029958.1 MetQ/NlpA family ABC transporter substrate-binding protein [Variovorax sp. J31P216]